MTNKKNLSIDKLKSLWLYIAIVTGLFLIALSVLYRGAILNDGLWHMAMGRWMVEHKAVPDYAIGAWGGESLAWVAQEWLYQVLLYISCNQDMSVAWTLNFLLFYMLFMFIGIFAGLSNNITTKLKGLTVFILCAFFIMLAFAQPRPQTVSVIILISYVLLLKAYLFNTKREYKYLAYMFMLGVFWANIHAGVAILGYLIPLGLLLGYFLADKFKFISDKFDTSHVSDLTNRLSYAGCTMLLSVFLTPYGIKGFMYPIISMGDDLMLNLISEWQSPNFNDVSGLIMFWLPFLSIIIWLVFSKVKNIKYYDVLILGIFLLLTLKHIRMAIYLLTLIALIIPKYCSDNEFINIKLKPVFLKIITVVCVLLMAVFMKFISFKSEGLAESEFFNQIKEYSGDRPYNYYDLGSIMQYYNIPVFIDARYDPFSKNRMPDVARLKNIDSTSDEMQQIMDKYNFTSIIDRDTSPIILWASRHGYKKQASFDTGEISTNLVGDKMKIIYEFWVKDN